MKDNKLWYEKINIILGSFASICTIIGTSIFGVITYINNQETETIINESEECDDTYSNIEDYDVKEDGSLTQDTTDKGVESYLSGKTDDHLKKKMIINVESEVKNIKTKYYNFQKIKIGPINHTLNSKILIYYVQQDNSISIEIPNGYSNINYSRIYYFDENGQLYFAFIFNKVNENRLYFLNDILIRYINEEKKIYDINDNLDNCEFEELALTESYELFNSINQ